MLTPATRAAIYHNSYMKIYPDGGCVLLVADRSIFREAGWEERRRKPLHAADEEGADIVCECEAAAGEEQPAGEEQIAGEVEAVTADTSRARRRARSAIFDLARCNDFKYFVTFTLDETKVDRYDVGAITLKLNNWLDNNVRRRGLKYVLVPELHKDGAVHFHGLINDALPVTDSGTIITGTGRPRKPRRPRSLAERHKWLAGGGHVVYNVAAWSLGFSTAIELYGDPGRAIGYVCKYISKTTGKVGGRWYYSGGALARPLVAVFETDFAAAAATAAAKFTLEGLGSECCRIEFESMEDFDNARESLGIR